LRIDSMRPMLKIVARIASLRSRLTRIPNMATRLCSCAETTLHQVGRYPEIPLMEDVASCEESKSRGGLLLFRIGGHIRRRWEQEESSIHLKKLASSERLHAGCRAGELGKILQRGKGCGENFRQRDLPDEETYVLSVFVKSPEAEGVKSRLARGCGREEDTQALQVLCRRPLDSLDKGNYCLKLFYYPPDGQPSIKMGRRRQML